MAFRRTCGQATATLVFRVEVSVPARSRGFLASARVMRTSSWPRLSSVGGRETHRRRRGYMVFPPHKEAPQKTRREDAVCQDLGRHPRLELVVVELGARVDEAHTLLD